MSGRQVVAALGRLGHRVIEADPSHGGVEKLMSERPDVAFIAMHGRLGEDGCMQGLLEVLGIPYTGSSVLGSALAMDKAVSKAVFSAAGVPTPGYVVLNSRDSLDASVARAAAEIGVPCVVKPSCQGSTVGITIVKSRPALGEAMKLAFSYDPLAVVERYVLGTEVTVGVLGNDELKALPVLEIVPKNEMYDWESKYTPGMSEHIIPARIPAQADAECRRLAVRAHSALKCHSFSRVDMIVEPSGRVWVLEVNTIPGLTEVSLLPDAAKAAGITFDRLVQLMIDGAFKR